MVPVHRVGIDFDNTLLSYEHVFRSYAAAEGIVEPGQFLSKREIRDLTRSLADGDRRWQALQGQVYGRGIAYATPIAGARQFIRRCREAGIDVVVVSHKTRFGHHDPCKIDLRQGAVAWLEQHGFLDQRTGLRLDGIYWESTRQAKIARIGSVGCDVFIDDLEEVLSEPDFPRDVERILLSDVAPRQDTSFAVCRNWGEIEQRVLN